MLAHKFFKLFPPPKFLNIPYAGLHISDDAIHCIEYVNSHNGLAIRRFGMKPLAPGVIEGGDIKDEAALIGALSALSKELKIYAVKASLPEEKMYLFKTTVPSVDIKEMRQNIEFKLEENVPLTVSEALFFFDLIPKATGVVMGDDKGDNPAGVSVAPQAVVNSYLAAIKAAGITVLSFEVDAKGLARAVVPQGYTGTDLLVNIMNKKTGLYIVCGGVVCFSSTVSWGCEEAKTPDGKQNFEELKRSIHQVRNYWNEHGLGTHIERVVFAGKGSLADGLITECSMGFGASQNSNVRFEIAKVWQNAFSPDDYIPPISREESLDYGVAAGLALPVSNT